MNEQNNSQRKIFIVDDDTFLLDMYSQKFSKVGYEVKSSESTDNALKMLRDGYMPDIMLVDIVMPGMDGLEFVSHVRKESLAQKTCVIMLTNQGASEDIAKAKSMNVDGYIIKATTIPSEVINEVEKIYKSKKV